MVHGSSLSSEICHGVISFERAEIMQRSIASGGIGSAIAELEHDFFLSNICGRNGLNLSQRSLFTIGIFVAQRQTKELKDQIKLGIANGLSIDEIEEALIQAVPYVGFPAVADAVSVLKDVSNEIGLEDVVSYSDTAAHPHSLSIYQTLLEDQFVPDDDEPPRV